MKISRFGHALEKIVEFDTCSCTFGNFVFIDWRDITDFHHWKIKSICYKARFLIVTAEKLPNGFPLISQAPTTKVVEMGHNAVLLCTAVGSPPPIISWVRDMLPIDTTNPRYTVLETGEWILSLIYPRRCQIKRLCLAENNPSYALTDSQLPFFPHTQLWECSNRIYRVYTLWKCSNRGTIEAPRVDFASEKSKGGGNLHRMRGKRKIWIADRSKMLEVTIEARLGGACHISSSARVRKSLSTGGSVDRVVTRYGNIQHIHLVCRERAPALHPLSSPSTLRVCSYIADLRTSSTCFRLNCQRSNAFPLDSIRSIRPDEKETGFNRIGFVKNIWFLANACSLSTSLEIRGDFFDF